MQYAKFLAAVVTTVLSAIVAASTDSILTNDEWINIAIVGVGALAVFAAPNVPGARYTKSILAVLAAVLTLLVSVISNGITPPELIQLVIAALGALGIYAVKNEPSSVESSGQAAYHL